MEINVTILGVKKIDFSSSDGKKVQGTRVFYSAKDSKDDNLIGHNVLTEWFEGFEVFDELAGVTIPGDFQLEHSIKMQGSKPKVKIEGFLPV